MTQTEGRRRRDVESPADFEPGDYGQIGDVWWARLPNGDHFRIDERWSVTEHEDGTITVGPSAPGEKHSIRSFDDDGDRWHGHLIRGVWRA